MAKEESVWHAITHPRNIGNEQYRRLIHKARLFVGGGLLVSICVFFVLAWLGGINTVIDKMLSANPFLYLMAFISVFVALALRYIKWSYYLRMYKLKPPFWKSLAVYFSLYAMDITPGQIGRMVAAYTLSRISKSHTIKVIPVVTMDIFTDAIGFAILTFLTSVYFDSYVIYVVIADIVLVAPIFLFLVNNWFFNAAKGFMSKHGLFRIFTIYGDEYFASQSVLNKPSVYLVSLLVTIPATFLWASAFYFTLLAMGPHVALGPSIFVFSTSTLFGMVSTIPGNIGVTDGSLVALSQTFLNLPSSTSYAAAIMARLATLWFGIIFGSIFLFYTMRYWKPRRKG